MMKRRLERGSTMVETAIVLSVALFLIFGIIDAGRALYTYHLVANAATLGARFAAVRGKTCAHTATSGDTWPCPSWSSGTPAPTSEPSTNPTAEPIASGTASPAPGDEITEYVQQQSQIMGLDSVWVNPTWSNFPDCVATSGYYNGSGCLVSVQVAYHFTPWLIPSFAFSFSSTAQQVMSQ